MTFPLLLVEFFLQKSFSVLTNVSPLVINNYARDSKRCHLFQRDCMCSVNLRSLSKLPQREKNINNALRELQILTQAEQREGRTISYPLLQTISLNLICVAGPILCFRRGRNEGLGDCEELSESAKVNRWHSWDGRRPEGLLPKPSFSLVYPLKVPLSGSGEPPSPHHF